MEEFLNEQKAAKFLGVCVGVMKRLVKPISPEQGVMFRVSDLKKAKEHLKENPVKRGRPKKVKS